MKKRDFLTEITQRKKRNEMPLRISAFSKRYEAIGNAFMRLLNEATPNGTTFDEELCRYFPIALTAAIEGYFKQAIADLTDLGEPYQARVQAAKKRHPKPEVSAAVASGAITLGDWYSHVTSFGSLHEIDELLSEILDFPFLERLLNSEFKGIFDEEVEAFHLRDIQKEVIETAIELFQTRHMLCHEFALAVSPDIGTVFRILTVADVLVSLSDVVIFAEAEQRKK